MNVMNRRIKYHHLLALIFIMATLLIAGTFRDLKGMAAPGFATKEEKVRTDAVGILKDEIDDNNTHVIGHDPPPPQQEIFSPSFPKLSQEGSVSASNKGAYAKNRDHVNTSSQPSISSQPSSVPTSKPTISFQSSSKLSEKESSKTTNSIKELKIRHPYCFSEDLFQSNNDDDKKLSLARVGKYKLIGRDVTPNVLYDHQCPYMLMDRYNCARNNTDILDYGDNPTDWKLILTPQNEGDGGCNLWEFVHELGGPVGVASALATQHGQSQRRMIANDDDKKDDDDDAQDDHGHDGETNLSTKKPKKRPFIVMILGNSFLRQLFEALACGWSTDITDYRATVDSKACFSMACVKERKKRNKKGILKLEMEEFGDFLPPLTEVERSRRPDVSKKRFYRSGVTLPMKIFTKNVTDHLAMVEFGNSIRFYFMFRPYLHSNLTGVMEQMLHLDPAHVDMLLFNDDQDRMIAKHKDLKNIFTSTGAWQARSVWPYSRFMAMQKRDIRKWFGADNPWITNPPDNHACLPGAPDDEVNLLMFLIFSKAKILG